MEHKSSELLQEEQRAFPSEEKLQQEKQEETGKSKRFKVIFEKFSGATMGLFSSVFVFVFLTGIGYGVVSLCEIAFDHWFGELPGYEIGHNGLVYVGTRDAIMRECPNRNVLTDVTSLDRFDNATGVVCYKGKEGLLDLNTANFLLPAQYDKIWCAAKNTYMAVMQDTVYTIVLPGGEIVKREPVASFYQNILPLYPDNDVCYCEDAGNEGGKDVLLYEYTDYTGRCGIMNKDLQKLTPAIYSYIEAVEGKEGVFLCHFEDGEGEETVAGVGVGELRDIKGKKIE